MICHKIAVLSIVLHVYFAYAYTIDPCASIRCGNNEQACLEIIPRSSPEKASSYECRCAKDCKSLNVNYIKSPIVRTVPPSIYKKKKVNGTLILESAGVPIAKQGGSSCYPSACMNGGTCFSSYSPTMQTTTTTTASPIGQAICSCQPQFSGSRCEIYSPEPIQNWNNLCRVYNERNMHICQNGGQCVFISDGKVACVCPSTFIGQYCEVPVYLSCQAPVSAQCHRDYGSCGADGSCVCRDGYAGPKCDQRNYFGTGSSSILCLNGGTCVTTPNTRCICPPQYTGTRCEILVSPTAQPTAQPTISNMPTNPTNNPYYNPTILPVTFTYAPITNPTNNPYNIPTNPPVTYTYAPATYTYAPATYTFAPITNPTNNPYNIPTNPLTNAPYNPCASFSCVNGGTLTLVNGQCACNCPPNYTGTSCNVYISNQPSNNCGSVTCLNGGTCTTVNGQCICICPPNYTGPTCNIQVPTPTQPSSNCGSITCLNGGTCTTINGNCACICPPNYTGTTCGTLVSNQPSSCGSVTCLNGGSCTTVNGQCICICPVSYTGSRCETYIGGPQQNPTCATTTCLNGGTCVSLTSNPFVVCACTNGFTGSRCETPANTINPNSLSTSTSVPRCNLTIGVQNDGAYTARFRVAYTIDGIQQGVIFSPNLPFIGNTAYITIPYYSKNIVVSVERLGFTWAGIFQDTGIDVAKQCTKCYKVWGAVTDPRWDYLEC